MGHHWQLSRAMKSLARKDASRAWGQRPRWASTELPRASATQTADKLPQPRRSRTLPLLALGLLLGGTVHYLTAPARSSPTLNGDTFVPYAIAARDAISPSSVLLTVAPRTTDLSPPYLVPGSSRWRLPLWSVELKQPEVQIARHYTPLPGAGADGWLRFYVRSVPAGEMSAYLARLAPGRDVWLRGPHPGFDVIARLGARRRLVFLAGGTGLVPGMQAARAVLDASDVATVTLLWAVRRRGEVQDMPSTPPWWRRFWARRDPTELREDLERPSHVAQCLTQMKARYRRRLDIRVAVDDEGTQFRERDIQKVLLGPAAELPRPYSAPTLPGRGCQFHDQRLHETASEFATPGGVCRCPPSARSGLGKNLLVVSGPDGFVSHYAGPKGLVGRHPDAGARGRRGRRTAGALPQPGQRLDRAQALNIVVLCTLALQRCTLCMVAEPERPCRRLRLGSQLDIELEACPR